MAEYIEREAAINELRETHKRFYTPPSEPMCFSDVVGVIKNVSAADVVEVVRCKDCIWYTPDTEWGIDEATGKRDFSQIVTKPYGECHGQNFHFTEDGFLRVDDDDFCSYGERRAAHVDM